jgi:hypothetical protein
MYSIGGGGGPYLYLIPRLKGLGKEIEFEYFDQKLYF